jgi:hypothetical protein
MTQSANNKTEVKERKRLPSERAALSIALVAITVVLIANLHSFSEGWAWAIGNALITTNGLTLGFSIVVVTIVAERALSVPRMTDALARNLVQELKKRENKEGKISIENVNGTFSAAARTAFDRLLSVPSALFHAFYLMLVSLLLAFALFGVNDSTISNSVLTSFFLLLMIGSIFCLATGVYLMLQVLKELITRSTSKELDQAIAESWSNAMKQIGGANTN